MIGWLRAPWFTALAGGLIYLAVTLALIRPSALRSGLPSIAPAPPAEPDEASWRFRNPEFDQWIEEIRREKDALAAREQQLQALERRVEADRQELAAATQIVCQLQAQFDRNVVRIRTQEVENLKRQAKVLASMSADGAASLINEMADDDAVRILYTLRPNDAGTILDTLSKTGPAEAKRAAQLAERMRLALPPESNPPLKTSP
jgi:flagellar motility protein MotE (MotC chaperone)